ncbi:hypothetical protein SAY86_018683 [Trapa natans]|uniref:Rhodanese domain-containing protein n=1 Tax=Trapa natans TaxID=22666 RepID=A0AAN7LNC4_TRANT|nr:hypothetical protein SAY86_018683 [Trapa natans]
MGSLGSPVYGVDTIDVLAAKDLVASGHYYLDVRTEEEFKNGFPDVGKVINIPYLFITPEGRVKNPLFLEQVSHAYSVEDKIVVGCRSGVRSLDAGLDLVRAGYKHIVNMGGGHLEWMKLHLPVKKPLINHEEELGEMIVPAQKERAEDNNEMKNKIELPLEKPKPTCEVEAQVN